MVESQQASNQAAVKALQELLGERTLTRPADLLVYECDALTMFKTTPLAVSLPESTREVAAIVKICTEHGVAFLPRGAGTGLSGGAKPVENGILIAMSRLNKIINIDLPNRLAVIQPGLINIELSNAVAQDGFYYAPDPSSQMACTIGGNVAENSGGPHCLKHGMTTKHILALTVVLPTGEIVQLGSSMPDSSGYDLVGLFVGSEGTLGIATEVTVRLEKLPQAVRTYLASYASMNQACATVSEIVARGLNPAAMEILDHLTIAAVEASIYAAGYPLEADAVLLVELDGSQIEVDVAGVEVVEICEHHQALHIEQASEEIDRKRLWKGRKGAFGAMGRINTDLLVMDGVVPRHKLQWILEEIYAIGKKYGVKLTNILHAGDGNLHPNISYDGRDAEETQRVLDAGEEILWKCVQAGGTLSGEHGIGVEKRNFMPFVFDDADLELMGRVRDSWNPQGLCNPGKILPTAKACVEARGRMLTLDTESPPASRGDLS